MRSGGVQFGGGELLIMTVRKRGMSRRLRSKLEITSVISHSKDRARTLVFMRVYDVWITLDPSRSGHRLSMPLKASIEFC